jgi:hypothetical protein
MICALWIYRQGRTGYWDLVEVNELQNTKEAPTIHFRHSADE